MGLGKLRGSLLYPLGAQQVAWVMIGHSALNRPEVFLQVDARNVLGDIRGLLPQLAGSFSIVSHFFQESARSFLSALLHVAQATTTSSFGPKTSRFRRMLFRKGLWAPAKQMGKPFVDMSLVLLYHALRLTFQFSRFYSLCGCSILNAVLRHCVAFFENFGHREVQRNRRVLLLTMFTGVIR